MIISSVLMERFCKDTNLPIKIFKEPYFSNLLNLYDKEYNSLKKFEIFKEFVSKFNTEQDYLAEYDNLKETVISYLHENEKMVFFSTMEDMNKFKCKNIGYRTNNIFVNTYVDKYFVSIDMNKANFTALRHYDESIVMGKKTYEDFLGEFTEHEHFKKSKYIRQVIFGNMNPSRQITYEKFLMDKVLTELLSIFASENIVSFAGDEIVVELAEKFITEETVNPDLIRQLNDLQKKFIEEKIDIKIEFFKLLKVEQTTGYIKKNLLTGEYTFKCFNSLILPFVMREYLGEEPNELDGVFYHDGNLAKLLETPKIIIPK